MAVPRDRYGYPVLPPGYGAPLADYQRQGGVAPRASASPAWSPGPLAGLTFGAQGGSEPMRDALDSGAQGLESYLGETGVRTGMLRRDYKAAASLLAPGDRAGREALKVATRKQTPAPMRYLIESLRSDVGPKPGSVGGAARTNPKWNLAGGAMRGLGLVGTAAAIVDGADEIARSSDRPRTTAGVAGSTVGGIGGGIAGAEAGGALGLLGGPAAVVTAPVGAIIGGLIGSIAGGAGGRRLTTDLYDQLRRRK